MNRLTGPTTYQYAVPQQDQPGSDWHLAFGSAHPGVFLMATCDNSVKGLSFDIDLAVHHAYGTRAGDETVTPPQ